MRIKSPLSNLSEIINQIKESAAQYRTTLQRNEAATRAVLIDPILQSLGWDTANIYMVEVEKTLDQSRVDYALYDSNANVSLIVEAKQLGTNLNDNTITMSMVKYAYNFGTKRIFLTDGLVWQYVTIGEPGHIDISTINFVENNPVDCAAFLVERLDAARFWPDQQTIDELAQRISQLESSLATLQKEVAQREQPEPTLTVPPKTAITPRPTLTPPISPIAPTSPNFTDLAAIGDATHTTPSLLRLPDETVIKVNRWKDVLRECCKFALGANQNIPVPFPDRAGKKVRLLDFVRPHAGVSFIQEEYKGQPIYIYVNYDANNSTANAVHILKQVPPAAQKARVGVVFSKVPR